MKYKPTKGKTPVRWREENDGLLRENYKVYLGNCAADGNFDIHSVKDFTEWAIEEFNVSYRKDKSQSTFLSLKMEKEIDKYLEETDWNNAPATNMAGIRLILKAQKEILKRAWLKSRIEQ